MFSWKKVGAILAVSAASAGISILTHADESKPPVTRAAYLQQLQVKLDHTARRANKPNAEGSAVVGLRGSKQESASKQLYWKGKSESVAVTPEEVKDFRSAVEAAQSGKDADAIAALKAFQEKFPQSPLLPDVEQTLTQLAAAPQP
jgi:TolA-binding protein